MRPPRPRTGLTCHDPGCAVAAGTAKIQAKERAGEAWGQVRRAGSGHGGLCCVTT